MNVRRGHSSTHNTCLPPVHCLNPFGFIEGGKSREAQGFLLRKLGGSLGTEVDKREV